MAESIARREASDVLEPSSAGLYPLGRISERTEETLRANGYSTEGLSSKSMDSGVVAGVDLIVNLSGISLGGLFGGRLGLVSGLQSGQIVEDWEIADPYGEDAATYQRILEEIELRIHQLARRYRTKTKAAGA